MKTKDKLVQINTKFKIKKLKKNNKKEIYKRKLILKVYQNNLLNKFFIFHTSYSLFLPPSPSPS